MIKNKNKTWGEKKLVVTLLIISFIMANFFIAQPLIAQTKEENSETPVTEKAEETNKQNQEKQKEEEDLSELNQQIEDRRREIDILQKEINAYASQIKTKQGEARGLRNQIAILDNQVAKVNLDIETTEIKIDQTNLEIQSLNLQIESLEKKIEIQKGRLAEYIRLIYKTDQVSYLEVILVNESFSDFFDQIKYTQSIHSDLKAALDRLKGDKQDLEIQKTNWEEKARLEEELKDQLHEQKSELTEKNNAQGILLLQARLTEKEYQNYQYQLQLEQQQVNSDITTLEKQVRAKLEDREVKKRFMGFGPARLIWPVSPARGITTYFHDPDYPFRYIFEHPGLDIRAYQGTPIAAPESGYVARVKFKGDSSYSYIMLIHNDGLSTVFGHVSSVNIKEDEYVTKGQTIALTGGMPGTTGAGRLSTGPHSHFEVRLNGIPVNPLEYLPSF